MRNFKITAKGRYLPCALVEVRPQPTGCVIRIDDTRHPDVWVEVWVPVELLREMLSHAEQANEMHQLIDEVWGGKLPPSGAGDDPLTV